MIVLYFFVISFQSMLIFYSLISLPTSTHDQNLSHISLKDIEDNSLRLNSSLIFIFIFKLY
jgi:hypothetical protein